MTHGIGSMTRSKARSTETVMQMMRHVSTTIGALLLWATLGNAQPAARPATATGMARSSTTPRAALQTAVFAGGCFWGVEAVFEHIKGVTQVVSGYAGGTVVNPDYESVSSGRTGHAEAVRVTFDPSVVSYDTLLSVFFTVAHNPTELNRQGPDVGTQYRSAIFYNSPEQQKAATAYIAKLAAARTYPKPIVTQVAPLSRFNEAEAYHQNYLYSHTTQPYIVYNDLPKIDALKKQFPALWEQTSGK
jgi:peptide-methionine (S)-S-oxide reductase